MSQGAGATKLSRAQMAAFIAPAAPLGAIALPPLVFLPSYFNTQLGVPLAAVSAIFLCARLSDIIIDPLLGGLQDRTKSMLGRRRAWLLGALFPLCLLIWLAFIGWRSGAAPLWIGASMMAMYAAFSASLIAHLGWAGELRPDYHGRTHILGLVQLAATAGSLGVLLLPAIAGLANWGGPGAGVHLMGWALIVALPLTILPAVFFVPEPHAEPGPPITLKAALSALTHNKALAIALIADFAIGVAQGISGSLFVFYFQIQLGFTRESEVLLLVYFLAALFGVPAWMAVAKKGAKHKAISWACFYAGGMTLLLPILPPGQVLIAAIGLFFAGFANGAHIFLLRAMMADVVDEDEVKSGQRRAGLFFGMLLTTSKIGSALGPVTFAILAAFGFDGKLGPQNNPEALGALTILFIGGPALLYAIAGWAMRFYPLSEARQRELRAQLRR